MDQNGKASPGRPPIGKETMSSGLVHAKNYHRWNFDWIAPYVRGRVLDIGGGTGNHLAFLRDVDVVSIDLSDECVADLRAHHGARSNWRFEVGDITNPEIVARFGRDSFDTVLSCNVFEHIEDDGAAFANSSALLKGGGCIVLLLPAHPRLFGSMDRLAGHYRRYSADDAAAKLRAAGLEVAALRYVNLVGAIGWYVNSRLIRHRDLSSTAVNRQIRTFDRWMVPALRMLEGRRTMPFGQSLVCVGRKPVASTAERKPSR